MTQTKTAGKWFYPLQAKAKSYLLTHYADIHSCNWQRVYKDEVYESFTVFVGDTTQQVLVIMNKQEQISVYEMKGMFHI